MVENIIENILGYSICGISLGFVIYLVIYVVVFIRKAKRENKITHDTIVECFKDVVIPKDLRINLSKTIKPVIKDQIVESIKPITESYNKLLLQNHLMLSILSKFTHAQDLTEEEKTLMEELLKDPSIQEIEFPE